MTETIEYFYILGIQMSGIQMALKYQTIWQSDNLPPLE